MNRVKMQYKQMVRGFTTGALALVVIAGVAVPADAAVRRHGHRGVTIPSSMGPGTYGFAEMTESMRNAKATGVNAVTFVYTNCQRDQFASAQFACPDTPTDDALAAGIRNARALGVRAHVIMHQRATNDEWQGNFCPRDRSAWFAAYTPRVVAAARVAQAAGANQFIVGAEMPCLTLNMNHPQNETRWRGVIAEVRKVFTGQLTYSAQRDSTYKPNSEVSGIEFWDALDLIGASAYYPMPAGSPSAETLRVEWNKVYAESYRPAIAKWGKKLAITEVGFRSMKDSHVEPWNFTTQNVYDAETQARSYKAVIDLVSSVPALSGISFWTWEPDPKTTRVGDTSYSPEHKPAATVMRQSWQRRFGTR